MKDTLQKNADLGPLALHVAAQMRARRLRPAILTGLLRALDGVLVFLAAVTARDLTWDVNADFPYIYAASLGCVIAVVMLNRCNAYQMMILRDPMRSIGAVLQGLGATFAILLIGEFLSGGEMSRAVALTWAMLSITSFVLIRIGCARLLARWAHLGWLDQRIAIVGGGPEAEALVHSLKPLAASGVHLCGLFDDREAARSPDLVEGAPKLGTIADLLQFARMTRLDMLIVTLPMTAEGRIVALLSQLWVLPVDIRLAVHHSALRFKPRAYSYLGDIPLLDLFDRPIRDWDAVIKRIFDLLFASIGVIILAPAMAAVAIAVRLDSPGPILFRQIRHGFNNEPVSVLKFRSMYATGCDATAIKAVQRADPRVTRVGRFIRKTSLDELPQFFNVLRGDLSLVGPRPHATAGRTRERVFEDMVDAYFARHRVKPGITGWAQINGWRGEIDADEKIRQRIAHDLHYIDHWSVWFDLRILFLTPIRLLRTENVF
jgi:Undecaprenyl-phosphate glucose phosphotransferase